MSLRDWSPGARKRGEIQIKILGNLGDRHPLDYGGHVVYRAYDPVRNQSWITSEYWPEPPGNRYEVYAWDVEKDVARDLEWPEWRKVADFSGIPYLDLMALTASENPLERAMAYEAVGRYYGFGELDPYPLQLTRREMERRWPEYT